MQSKTIDVIINYLHKLVQKHNTKISSFLQRNW